MVIPLRLLKFAICVCLFLSTQLNAQYINLVDYVNPLVGSASDVELSTGNTYPAIALPWGMNFWTPQTAKNGDGWQYTYSAKKITGFKETHQPSPWINDYGCFSLMPMTGKLKLDETSRSSWFSHKSEKASPYYYSVYLATPDVKTEITPTDRASQFRFTFPKSDEAFIVLDAFHKGSYVKIIPEQRKIIGYSSYNSGGVPDGFHNYFVLVFDTDFDASYTWNDLIAFEKNEILADHCGAALQFKTVKGQVITVKIASSFISPEQAELNLQ